METAPHAFRLTGDGRMWGTWTTGHYAGVTIALDDEDMRFYGYEKCFCYPPIGYTDPECTVCT